MKQYEIKVNENQLRVIAEFLEWGSRFCAGQTKHLPSCLEASFWKKYTTDEFCKRRDTYERLLDGVTLEMFNLAPNASFGIGSKDLIEEAKVAYDIYRPILEEFNKDSKHYNVYSSPGLSYSQDGRIKVKEVKDE